MILPRLIFFALLAATTAGLAALMTQALSPGGWTLTKFAILAAFLPCALWLGVCAGNAIPGFLIRLLACDPPRAVLPVRGDIDTAPITTRTAIAVTIRNEDMATVLPSLAHLLATLDDPAHFTLFLLSDTQDAASAAAEAEAIAAFPHPIRYRRRTENSGYKAGNVMDFLNHHVGDHDFTLMLDADSEISAASVRRLVRILQADPRMGLVQHLICGRPAAQAFPRLFQFGMRAGMRIWSTGQAYWQGDEGPYWGHNALFRSAPFRDHCRLEPLPDGSTILSHDQIEAARLRAAGWGVCVWADDDGSTEANPPAMPEFLHRDGRWLAGNLQYRHLLALPGFRPMGRWQLVQAILMFASAPLYVFIFTLAILAAQTAPADYPSCTILALAVAWAGTLYAPKLLGYVEILLSPHDRARYGGASRFLVGAVAEIIFTLLLDAAACVTKTLAMLRLALGARPGWLPQNRSDRGVGWSEATRMFWPHTLLGLTAFAALLNAAPAMALLALPFAGGLLAAIPFCVLTANPGFSEWLRRHRIAAMPEEIKP